MCELFYFDSLRNTFNSCLTIQSEMLIRRKLKHENSITAHSTHTKVKLKHENGITARSTHTKVKESMI